MGCVMALNREGCRTGAPARDWKPSFIGGLIAKSLMNPKPLNGPKVFRPGPTPRNGIVEALIARELRFVQAMDAAACIGWTIGTRYSLFP